MNSKTARLAVLLTAFLWSSGGLAVKITDCAAEALTGWRCLFCLLLFAVFYRKKKLLTFSKEQWVNAGSWRRKLLSFSPAQWIGAVSYFLTAYFYIASTQLTTAANAVLLQYTAPIFVALLSGWLLQEKVSRKDRIMVAVVIAGVVLFFVDKVSPGGMKGNFIALLSGFTFALFIICTRMQKDAHPAGSIFLGNVIALIVCLPSMVQTSFTYDAVLGGMYLGLIYGGLSYILYSSAIRYVPALTAVLIATIEPILNPVWVYFLVGEKPSLFAVFGGVIVVGTILVGNIMDLKK